MKKAKIHGALQDRLQILDRERAHGWKEREHARGEAKQAQVSLEVLQADGRAEEVAAGLEHASDGGDRLSFSDGFPFRQTPPAFWSDVESPTVSPQPRRLSLMQKVKKAAGMGGPAAVVTLPDKDGMTCYNPRPGSHLNDGAARNGGLARWERHLLSADDEWCKLCKEKRTRRPMFCGEQDFV